MTRRVYNVFLILYLQSASRVNANLSRKVAGSAERCMYMSFTANCSDLFLGKRGFEGRKSIPHQCPVTIT